ncbi:hypothetical protein NMS08_003351 [Vibrio cholerae]|nr:hypothetical protein [Vibrio cholerae]
MEYFIGALMGYFVGTNALVEKQVRRFVGYGYSNQVMGFLKVFTLFWRLLVVHLHQAFSKYQV